jgi:Dolichyl-phosphate-mannose-protein mannosyltransferase
MIVASLGLLVPTLLVYLALAPVAASGRRAAPQLLRVALAMGLAAGITSALWFLWFALFDTPGTTYFASEMAILLGAAAWGRRIESRWLAAAPAINDGGGPIAAVPARLALAVVVLLTLSGTVAFVANTVRQPHGSWDAVAIWNLHARFLTAGYERWSHLLEHSQWCAYHGDYPVLLPGCVARLWSLAGGASRCASGLVAYWFTAATVLLCGAAVGCVRGRSQALLAAAALLGTTAFVRRSSDQYADVPLGWFMLAAVVALVLHDENGRRSRSWLVLAGVATGLAAWTKNEGILFAAVLVAVRGIMTIRSVGARAAVREAAPFAAGLLPIMALLVAFKLTLAPENDLVAGQDLAATVARLLDVSRYRVIAAGLTTALLQAVKVLLVVLPFYYFLMGPTRRARARDGARFAAAVFGLTLVGYVGVYLTTPQALEWHLHTSARRLLLQLWPGAVTAFFLAVAAPEERLRLPSTELKEGEDHDRAASLRVPSPLPLP